MNGWRGRVDPDGDRVSRALSSSGCSSDVGAARASRPGESRRSRAAPRPPADQPVNADAKALAGFLDRVNQYVGAPPEARKLAAKALEGIHAGTDRHAPARPGEADPGRAPGRETRRLFTPESQAVVQAAAGEGVRRARRRRARRPRSWTRIRACPTSRSTIAYPDTFPFRRSRRRCWRPPEAAGRNGIPVRRQRPDPDGHARAHRRRLRRNAFPQ